MSNLPTTPEWLNFTTSLDITDKAKTPKEVITALEFFEVKLRRQKGLAPDAALFVTRKERNAGHGHHNSSNNKSSYNNSKRNKNHKDKREKTKCEGCGYTGHTRDSCHHPERWEAYARRLAQAKEQKNTNQNMNSVQKSESTHAHLAKTDSETSKETTSQQSGSFLFAMFDGKSACPSTTESTFTIDALHVSSTAEFTPSDWILDTGASHHITGNRQLFSFYQVYASGEHLVRTANNQVVSAAGIGTVPVRHDGQIFLLRNVLHVPACGDNNLLSILQLLRKDLKINFDQEKATLSVNSCNIATAYVKKDLFILKCDKLSTTNPEECSIVFAAMHNKVNSKDILLWHARLGHLSLPAIKRAISLVKGIEIHARSPSECICEACILGKMARKPFSKESGLSPKTHRLELIHTDVCGPMPTQSRKGYRYFVMFTDDATRYSSVYFIRTKSEVFTAFQEYKTAVEKMFGSSILRLRMDGGGEYSGAEFLNLLWKEGIQVEASTPYTPQQNGISERCNRTVMDPARTMLKHAGMPNHFWADAVKVAVFLKNRLPTRALPNTTPHELWFGRQPDLSHLRIFGSLAYAWTPSAIRKKLDDHARKSIFIGYTSTSQQYLLYDIVSKREFLARDIQFNEACLYSQLVGKSSNSPSTISFEIPENSTPQDLPPVKSSFPLNIENDANQQLQEELAASQQFSATSSPPPPPPQDTLQTESPTQQAPGDWIDSGSELSDVPEDFEDASSGLPSTAQVDIPRNLEINMNMEPPKTNTRTRSGRALFSPVISTAFMVEPGPKTFRAALKTSEADQWTDAVDTETTALASHQAMQFVTQESIPPGATIIESRWLFTKKFKATGEIDKYKARLIALGYTQVEGQDYDGNAIFSPVVDSSIIRFCLGLAAWLNFHIAILDCPTAFLGSTLHEKIFLRLPEGNWEDPWKRPRPLVRLLKTLYGLKQSPRGWFEDVYEFLLTQNLTASIAAPGLFYGKGIIVLVYVDDIMVLSATIENLRSLCNALYDRFHAAPPKGATIPIGNHFQYVGLDIQLDRKNGTAFINQSGYIEKVLDQFNMTSCRPRFTPMEEGLKLSLHPSPLGEQYKSSSAQNEFSSEPTTVDQSTYRKAIGCLLYIALGSRPDIAYATTTLGRFSSNPNSIHWTAVKHLFCYLKATASLKLTLNSKNHSSIEAYADADLGGEKDTGKSTTGYLVYVCGILVLWKSKKQTLVAQSTMEAELIASATVKKQIDWFEGLLSEISSSIPQSPSLSSIELTTQPLLFNDNLACVTVLKSGNFKGENRHLRLRFYALHEAVATGKLDLNHIISDQMLADGLTKALGKIKHEKFVHEIGLI